MKKHAEKRRQGNPANDGRHYNPVATARESKMLAEWRRENYMAGVADARNYCASFVGGVSID